jgi:fructose-bisphosphate aldolase class II
MGELSHNGTLKILRAAEEGGYGVACVNCYNMDAVIGALRAAEKKKSPVMIQVFPWSIQQFGSVFINFCADAIKQCKVPASLHLDHAMREEDIKAAMELPFDSIMVDMSRHSEEDNVKLTKTFAIECAKRGIATEAELGRIDGGEDGVMGDEDIEALMTKPEDAVAYIKETGVNMLAPSFGNIHGDYPPEGPEAFVKFNVLKDVKKALESHKIPIVLHGTNDFNDKMMKKCVEYGVVKFNVNKVVAEEYYKYVEDNFNKIELTKVIEGGLDRFQNGVEQLMDAIGSTNKA